MSFDVTEVEEDVTEVEVASLLFGGSFHLLWEEQRERKEKEEFWADPCWSEE